MKSQVFSTHFIFSIIKEKKFLITNFFTGIIKNPGTEAETLEVTGKFSYKLSDGTPIELTYIANEGGFQPSGAHLPQPPPIPDAIQRALDYIASQPQKAEGSAPKPFFAKPK